MQDKRTRRRLLADMLFVGGALLGASALTRPEPFFEQLLEGQEQPPPEPIAVTKAYPSDSDCHEGPPPMDVTCAYPSDSDTHEQRLRKTRKPGPSGQARPFWSWLA
jgi:hypothetical protein